MSSRFRAAVTAVVALVAVAGFTGVASALTLSISPGGAITGTSTNSNFRASGINITCTVNLIGTLVTSVDNTAGRSLGSITSGTATPCTGGSALVLANPAWNVSLTNAVPLPLSGVTSTGLTISGVGFLVDIPATALRCLYGGTIRATLTGTGGIPNRTTGITVSSQSVPLVANLSARTCPPIGTFSATFSIPTQTISG
ncbi:conserved hypothetical protein [Conexibacter woesei DSM 14684]|uniref:Uncharacterized protein n=1 Tax=Conexibacter woesei (strain DSM 14684 / CCUG 47730 / CIP 108061 / JCM 11494 / NBRC 100937 / ID131577) TaxID=469383 RepID=D3FB93_CONWI|nr:conserved hypothetical protein [Conexibacter woesei DSM 14684]